MAHRAAVEPADRIAAAHAEFSRDVTYLDTATLGLAPRRTLPAIETALDAWRRGITDAVGFDEVVDASWRSFTELVGVAPAWVAVGPQVSTFGGLVAASLEPGSEVLTATVEFR